MSFIPNTRRGSGPRRVEAWGVGRRAATGRGLVKKALDGRAEPRGGGRRPEAIRQNKEDRRREAAAAKRARARYQVEQRRLLEERVLGQKR